MPPAAVLERPIERHASRSKSAPSALSVLDSELHELISTGGPLPADYASLNQKLRAVGDAVRASLLSKPEVLAYARDLTARHFTGTLQAQALERKYGYSGDFEIIDAIYRQTLHRDPALRRWDLFFHAQAAPVAVRNRKAWFHRLLDDHLATKEGKPLRVLDVASGPARDVREWMLDHPGEEVFFDCIDADIHAIDHARKLCAPFIDRVEFHHRNAMRFLPAKGYDLVWSAGLFDYLMDRSFVFLLKSLLAVTRIGGEVVIGNFSPFNPSRDYMELLGDWVLYHRTERQLIELAREAGAPADAIQVEWEPEGVNYFLHVRR
ncbi:MAG: class I SAM-dependent methyltransferase [Verrucomicrobiaceae bacterium]|nr:class I SAM-dependent methyltransferase [Verrucomicrobiaceae bacterium]